MKILQRFLPDFNHCLGRGPKSALAHVQAQARAAALSSLSELSLLLGRFVPEGLLERAAQKEHSRERIFSFRSTFWAFVSQVLTPRTSCLEVVRKVQSFCSAQGLPVPSESDAAYCQARKKLSIERLLKIHQSVSSRLEQQIFSGWLWHERKVVVVDGTGIQLADTKDNQQAYPQPSQQRPGCGFPVMQLVACFCLHTGGLLHWVSSKLTAHESPLLRQILPLLQAGTVLLADRGFASYSNLGLCQEHQNRRGHAFTSGSQGRSASRHQIGQGGPPGALEATAAPKGLVQGVMEAVAQVAARAHRASANPMPWLSGANALDCHHLDRR